MFENWPSKETIDEGYQSNMGTPGDNNTETLSEGGQSNSETLSGSQESEWQTMADYNEPRSCNIDVIRAKTIKQAEWLQ